VDLLEGIQIEKNYSKEGREGVSEGLSILGVDRREGGGFSVLLNPLLHGLSPAK